MGKKRASAKTSRTKYAGLAGMAPKIFLKFFADAKSRYERQSGREQGLICRVGDMNCAVLKLQKAAWTNDDLSKIGNQTGIFFSIWITNAGAAKGRVD